MNENEIYMKNLKVEEVPWHRLITAYGRAEKFPEYFDILWKMSSRKAVNTAFSIITSETEHQSTLWASTPYTIIFLVRIFEHAVLERKNNKIAEELAEKLIDFFILVAECFCDLDDDETEEPFPNFSDMLEEEYLCPEECDDDELFQLEEEGPFSQDLFYSIWYYSYKALFPCKPVLEMLEDASYAGKVNDLKALLEE